MRSVLFVSISMALSVALPSEATLIAVDLLAPGDARVTRDTESGLDWLDVTETTNLSYDDIAGGAGGWITDGWRHATTSEVCGLLAAGGAAPTPCPGSGYVSFTEDLGQLLFGLIGFTVNLSPGDGWQVIGLWGYFDDGGGAPEIGELELGVQRFSSGAADTYAAVQVDRRLSNDTGSDHGNFLVRATPVPEPASGLLLALGLAALAARGRPRGA